jgi:hypothetical protein
MCKRWKISESKNIHFKNNPAGKSIPKKITEEMEKKFLI